MAKKEKRYTTRVKVRNLSYYSTEFIGKLYDGLINNMQPKVLNTASIIGDLDARFRVVASGYDVEPIFEDRAREIDVKDNDIRTQIKFYKINSPIDLSLMNSLISGTVYDVLTADINETDITGEEQIKSMKNMIYALDYFRKHASETILKYMMTCGRFHIKSRKKYGFIDFSEEGFLETKFFKNGLVVAVIMITTTYRNGERPFLCYFVDSIEDGLDENGNPKGPIAEFVNDDERVRKTIRSEVFVRDGN